MLENGFRPLPDGMRDLPPEDASIQRYVESVAARVMDSWGFTEVIPSTIQFNDEVSSGPGKYIEAKTYKFSDRRGRVLTLRPEMTVPVARMVATGGWSFPAKVWYRGSVFRMQEDRSSRPHEFTQVGAEVFGLSDPLADAEIVAVCADCLRAAGIGVFRIGIGDVRVTNRLLEQARLGGEAVTQALEALQRRDMVLLKGILGDAGASPAVIDRIMEWLRPIPLREAVESGILEDDTCSCIRGVVEGLRSFDIDRVAYLDMSIVRDMTYYTGMVFEVYGKGIGHAVGGGGRYDGLLERFGISQPATGFALGAPEVAELIREQGGTAPRKSVTLVTASRGTASQAASLARSLRARGQRVRFDGDPVSREEAARRGAAVGATSVLYVTPAGCEEVCGEPGLPGVAWAAWLARYSELAGIH
ncbi:MAG: hypothetical protein HPY55_10110 [Firmicutes bacterium]|nr:hypothetical protein [Bacillota bacterium]